MIYEKVGKNFVNITFYHIRLRVDVRFKVKQEDCWLLITFLIAITQGASWKKLSLMPLVISCMYWLLNLTMVVGLIYF